MGKLKRLISLLVVVCLVFSLAGCGSKSISMDDLSVDTVRDILEKKLGAKEYDYSYNGGKMKYSDYEYFKDGYYITSEGCKNTNIGIESYAGMLAGNFIPHNSVQLRNLSRDFRNSGTDFVMYKISDKTDDETLRRTTGPLAHSTIMVYAEFKTPEDAMTCFENMTKGFFSDSTMQRYQSALDNMARAKTRYEGTLMGDWLNAADKGQLPVQKENLDKSIYSRSGDEATFNYHINFEVLKWGDIVRNEPDNLELIEERSFHYTGIRASHLRVEGNRLLYIEGLNLTTSKGKLDNVDKLCNALATDNPFNAKMSDDFKYQLAFYLSIWLPNSTRIDSI